MRAPRFGRYRGWLIAAAAYNVVAGTAIVGFPQLTLEFAGVRDTSVLPLSQAVGMQVLVFAPAYWWAAAEPWRFRHFVLVGAAAKLLGVVGFLVAAVTNQLPWSFGVVVVLNDLIWLPAFGSFVATVSRATGWRLLLAGR